MKTNNKKITSVAMGLLIAVFGFFGCQKSSDTPAVAATTYVMQNGGVGSSVQCNGNYSYNGQLVQCYSSYSGNNCRGYTMIEITTGRSVVCL